MTASRTMFINLPVADVSASRDFFAGLGFAFDPAFDGDGLACLKVNDTASVMLVARDRAAEFSAKPLADPRKTTQMEICVTVGNRADVDEIADAALAGGGGAAAEAQEHEAMYARSFQDLDGHQWEIYWMSTDPVPAGVA